MISRRTLNAALRDRLADVEHATGYYGQVGRRFDGTTDERPPTRGPGDPAVAPYFVLYPSPGTPGVDGTSGERDVADSFVSLDHLIQVTAVAADAEDLDALVDRIDGLLYRWRPQLDGAKCGPLGPPPGFNPGPYFPDTTVKPARLWTPLQYQLTAHQ